MRKKFFVSVLILSMVLSLAAPGAAFAEGEEKPGLSYVVLGSSQTNGYGLHGYVDDRFYNWSGSAAETKAWNDARSAATKAGNAKLVFNQDFEPAKNLTTWSPHTRFEVSVSGYRNLIEESYPALIEQKLEELGFDVTTHQLALSSMRPQELTVLLDNDFDGDEFTDWRFTDNVDQCWFQRDGGKTALRADYQKTITEADVITYDLGANDFAAYLANQLLSRKFTNDPDLTKVIDSSHVSLYYALRSTVEEQVLALAGDKVSASDMDTLNNVIDTLAYAVFGFIKHFDRNMELIYGMNPDVDITVVSIQNVMADVEVELEGIPIPMGTVVGIPISIANAYTAAKSPYCSRYAYADITSGEGHVTLFLDELDNYNGPEDLTQNMKDCLNVLDNDCFLKEQVTRSIENQTDYRYETNSKVFEDAYIAAYDTAVSIFKALKQYEPLDVTTILVDTETDYMKLTRTYFDQSFLAAAMASVKGENYEAVRDQAIADLTVKLSSDAISYFKYNLLTDFGNTFFAHPSPAGCAEAADLIFEAMESDADGRIALLKSLLEAKQDLIELGLRYGFEFAKYLVEKLAVALDQADLVADFNENFGKYWDAKLFAEWLTDYIDDGNTDLQKRFLDSLQSVETLFKKTVLMTPVWNSLAKALSQNSGFTVSSFSFTSLFRNNQVKNVVNQIKNYIRYR